MRKILFILFAIIGFSFTSCEKDEIEPSGESSQENSSSYQYVTTVDAIYITNSAPKQSVIEIYKKGGTLYCCPKAHNKKTLSKNTGSTWQNVNVKGFKYYYDSNPRYFFNY